MKAITASLLVTATLLAPLSTASAAPLEQQATIADTGSATQALCLLLRMLRAGYVDSSGGGPACAFP
ncbi:hypothetical protein [Nocardia abscessus]|uniref:hypothetical protein n=1 Tax=Nocardia abscessus TaxID=120957 RepID=UPI0024558F1A|nr:hypothetical protein [Nocardia abscessus]